jgi:hypothetical protein
VESKKRAKPDSGRKKDPKHALWRQGEFRDVMGLVRVLDNGLYSKRMAGATSPPPLKAPCGVYCGWCAVLANRPLRSNEAPWDALVTDWAVEGCNDVGSVLDELYSLRIELADNSRRTEVGV